MRACPSTWPITLALVLLFASPVAAAAQTHVEDDPAHARFVTDDLLRFWAVLDRAGDEELGPLLQRAYIDSGTVGVRDFVPQRIGSGEALAATIRFNPERYSPEVRTRSLQVLEFESIVRDGFASLEELYPAARFPDTYFLVGRLNSGGTVSQNGLLIGVEVYAHSDETMRRLPHVVVHEAVHFQQPQHARSTLLAQSIHEGAADFLAELASGAHAHAPMHEFANAREADVWQRFSAVMHESPTSPAARPWLYGGSPYEDGPSDLGYYVGYRICRAYYERASDKSRAIHDIVNVEDYDAFLAGSGYGASF